MDFKQIQELIKIVNKSSIGELTIEEGGFKITIKQKEDPIPVYSSAPAQTYLPAPMPAPQLQQAGGQQAPAANGGGQAPAAPKASDTAITIKSPMIGTFYRSSGPDKPAFINVGDEVTAGKTVCIIEAMKLFNEIESEVSGRIIKVLVDDASPVEYDQPLFLVEPA